MLCVRVTGTQICGEVLLNTTRETDKGLERTAGLWLVARVRVGEHFFTLILYFTLH